MKKYSLIFITVLLFNFLSKTAIAQEEEDVYAAEEKVEEEDSKIAKIQLIGSWIGSETTYQFEKEEVQVTTKNGTEKSTWELDEDNGIIRLGDEVPVKIYLSKNGKILTFEYDSKDRYYESNYYEEMLVNMKKTDDGKILEFSDELDYVAYFSKTWRAPKEGTHEEPVYQFKQNGTFEEWNFIGFPFEPVYDYRKNEDSGTWIYSPDTKTLKLKYYKGKGSPGRSTSFQISKITENAFYINGNSGRYVVCEEK